ncbi:MAG: tetratricopeptide repeat protein [Vampirovibrionales bacterium]|nr:tetratricopeptide repeat protein [Vampirovibrionales bacterium]
MRLLPAFRLSVAYSLALAPLLAACLLPAAAWANLPSQNPVNNTWGGRNLSAERDVEDQDYSGYIELSEQATQQIQSGQLSQAIETLQKAIPIAPKVSLAPLYNNLAAVYMRRGNYYLTTTKQPHYALADFEEAYYLLNTAWPASIARSPLHEKNRQIARENIYAAYHGLNISKTDARQLIDMAQQQREASLLRPASVTVSDAIAASLQSDTPEKAASLQLALGDIYNVLNRPDLAAKQYEPAAQKLNSAEAYAKLGVALHKASQHNAAIKALDNALAIDPQNPIALGILEAIWAEDIRNNPASVLGRANLAGVLQKRKSYDAALQLYSEAERLSRQPGSNVSLETQKLIRLNLGTLYQAMNQPAKALEAYNSILAMDPGNTQALYYRASLYKDAAQNDPRRMQEALSAYNSILAKNPNDEATHADVLSLLASGLNSPDPRQSDAARAQIDDYARRFPTNPGVQLHVAEALHKHAGTDLAKLDTAMAAYDRALVMLPAASGNTEVREQRAAVLANQAVIWQTRGNTQAARKLLTEAKALDAQNPVISDLMGQLQGSELDGYIASGAQAQQGSNWTDAISAYDKALQLDPSRQDVRRSLAGVLQQRNQSGDAQRAAKEYQTLITQLSPESRDSADAAALQYALGTAYQQAGDSSKARLAYEKANTPEAIAALETLRNSQSQQMISDALAAYQAKQYAKAKTLADQAIASDASNAMAFYTRGLVAEALKQPVMAISDYQKATQLDPDYLDAYYALGVALDTKGDAAGARGAFERYMQLHGQTQAQESGVSEYVRERLKTL